MTTAAAFFGDVAVAAVLAFDATVFSAFALARGFAAGRAERETVRGAADLVVVFAFVFATVLAIVLAAVFTLVLAVDFAFVFVATLVDFRVAGFVLLLAAEDRTADRVADFAAVFKRVAPVLTRVADFDADALARGGFAATRAEAFFAPEAAARDFAGVAPDFLTAPRARAGVVETPTFRDLSFFFADGIRRLLLCSPALETGQPRCPPLAAFDERAVSV